jgi:hypothetical protein
MHHEPFVCATSESAGAWTLADLRWPLVVLLDCPLQCGFTPQAGCLHEWFLATSTVANKARLA